MEAGTGTVGQTLHMTATSQWGSDYELTSPATGTVTTMNPATEAFDSGDTVLTINLAPVVVAEGDVPMFRDLGPGVVGPDVRQFERMLEGLGHEPGDVDGTWDDKTTEALAAWQGRIGVERTDSVPRGMMVFAEELPLRMQPSVVVGEEVAVGQPMGSVLQAAPTFMVALTEDQLDMVREGTAVTLTRGEAELQGVVSSFDRDDEGTRAIIMSADGGPLCPAPCHGASASAISTWAASLRSYPLRRESFSPWRPCTPALMARISFWSTVLNEGLSSAHRRVAESSCVTLRRAQWSSSLISRDQHARAFLPVSGWPTCPR